MLNYFTLLFKTVFFICICLKNLKSGAVTGLMAGAGAGSSTVPRSKTVTTKPGQSLTRRQEPHLIITPHSN